MHNERTMATEQIRAQIGTRKTVVGTKQLRKALLAKTVRFAITRFIMLSSIMRSPTAFICSPSSKMS